MIAHQGTANAASSAGGAGEPLYFERYRPQYHFSPPQNFMNDPNGLVYFRGTYHLYYQYNPSGLEAGNQSWGHAVSNDLVYWENLPVAIPETASGHIFSGSAVVDRLNASGFFPESADGGIVAIYTLATYADGQSVSQKQNIAYSPDAGLTFTDYAGDPVVDRGETEFRDPQVFWHPPTESWIMAVALSRRWQVLFYATKDLKTWTQVSSFGPAGLLGGQYEVPNLVRVRVEGTDQHKWVLLVSINPGAPQGGSATQYFVGEFDGFNFVPDDDGTRFMEFAKDAYAMQTYNNLPWRDAVAITWLSNWQYTNVAPTFPWRGQMSVPRVLTLRTTAADRGYVLAQNPVPELEKLRDQVLHSGSVTVDEATPFSLSLGGRQSFEVEVMAASSGAGMAMISLTNGVESLVVAYDWAAQMVYVDRGGTQGFSNPDFTGTFATRYVTGGDAIKLRALFDVSTLELFVDDGSRVATSLFFFKDPPDSLVFSAQGGAIQMNNLQVYAYRSIWETSAQHAGQAGSAA
jgi:sucrose-6-phosphate hydrolase SacC (GH32 family)